MHLRALTALGLVLASVASCTTSDNTNTDSVAPTDPPPDATSAPTSVESPAPADTPNRLGAPEVVDVAGVTVSEVRVTATDDVVALPEPFTAAGPVVQIDAPLATITEPVVVRLAGVAPPSDALAVVLHENAAGRWEALPATFADGFYRTAARSFSRFVPGFVSDAAGWIVSTAGDGWNAATGIIDDGLDWLTGRTDPPDPCGTSSYDWVATTGSPPDGAFHFCEKQNPSGNGFERVEFEIKSNRSFAMWIVVPRGLADYVWVEGSSWDLVGPLLTRFSGNPTDAILLGPGRRLTIGIQRPRAASLETSVFAYQDYISQLATYLTKHLGDVQAEVGTLLAAMACFNADEPLASWDRAAQCFSAGLDFTVDQAELAYADAVASGRLNLSQGVIDRIDDEIISAQRLNDTITSLKKVGLTLKLLDLNKDIWINNFDLATGYVELAGTTNINLLRPPIAPTPEPATPELTSCEGTDTSLIEGDLAQPVVCSFPYALAEATTTLGAGPAVIVTLVNTIERQQLASWWNVEEGPGVSGYTVAALVDAGVPEPTAQLLFDTLDACAGCGYRQTTSPPTTTGESSTLSGFGIGGTLFGSDADTAAAAIIAELGPPTSDTDWYDTGYDPNSEDDQCATPAMRVMQWPNLNIVLADYDPTTGAFGKRTFVAYSHFSYDANPLSPELETDRGVRLRSPAADAIAGQPGANIYDYGVTTTDGMWIGFNSDGAVNSITAGTELCQA